MSRTEESEKKTLRRCIKKIFYNGILLREKKEKKSQNKTENAKNLMKRNLR